MIFPSFVYHLSLNTKNMAYLKEITIQIPTVSNYNNDISAIQKQLYGIFCVLVYMGFCYTSMAIPILTMERVGLHNPVAQFSLILNLICAILWGIASSGCIIHSFIVYEHMDYSVPLGIIFLLNLSSSMMAWVEWNFFMSLGTIGCTYVYWHVMEMLVLPTVLFVMIGSL